MIVNSKGVEIVLDDHFYIDFSKIKYDASNGYARIGKTYLHRMIISAKNGQIIDHINQNKLDNRLCNLRIVSKSLNNYNKQIENKLGRGIYYDKYGKRYRACISHNNKTEKLGSFKMIEDAKIKYNKRALEIYGKDAILHT
jgi:alpha-L-fucosidase